MVFLWGLGGASLSIAFIVRLIVKCVYIYMYTIPFSLYLIYLTKLTMVKSEIFIILISIDFISFSHKTLMIFTDDLLHYVLEFSYF